MIFYVVSFAFFLDFFWGDPPWLVKKIGHPVILIGKIIRKWEEILRKRASNGARDLRFRGILFFFMVLCSTVLPCAFFIYLAYEYHVFFGVFIEIALCYQLFATRSLERESLKVYFALKQGDLPQSRLMLSYIVGRETAELSEVEITKATVETVAENTTDGIVAPLCFMCLFGAVGGVFYKTINTLDSMVGYRNEKYEDFGKFSAQMDDVVNFFPARLTAFSMLFFSLFSTMATVEGLRIFFRDRNGHKSPNAGQTESVVAGLLGVELGGNSVYFGELHKKATFGESKRQINEEDIRKTIFFMRGSSVVCLLFWGVCLLGVPFILSH